MGAEWARGRRRAWRETFVGEIRHSEGEALKVFLSWPFSGDEAILEIRQFDLRTDPAGTPTGHGFRVLAIHAAELAELLTKAAMETGEADEKYSQKDKS